MVLGIIGWIVLGLITALIASKFMGDSAEGLPFNILLGIVGAVAGGWLFSAVGSSGGRGFSFLSQMLAVIGAVALLVGWQAIQRSSSRA